jgi:predicted Rossmann fold nucleotide-binding protein DprA/Smf involved in DNA uptake
MKDLKKSLEKVASDLNKVAQQVEKLAGRLEVQTQAKPSIKKAIKKVSKKTAQPTAADTVYKVIARLKKGANMATIRQKTGYENRKIQNSVYKLKKQGRIKSPAKGVYAKA